MKTWIEVWVDSGSRGERLLILVGTDSAEIELLDPHEGNKTIARFASYEDAQHWLNEDEYDRVEGRYEMDPT